MPTWFLIAAFIALAVLGWNLYRRLGADRIEKFMAAPANDRAHGQPRQTSSTATGTLRSRWRSPTRRSSTKTPTCRRRSTCNGFARSSTTPQLTTGAAVAGRQSAAPALLQPDLRIRAAERRRRALAHDDAAAPRGRAGGGVMPDATGIRRVAMLGNHLPRQCGIATFTTHLERRHRRRAPDARLLRPGDERRPARSTPIRRACASRSPRATLGAYTPRRRLSERQRRRRALRAARVRHLRRQGRQPSAGAAARAAHADRDDAAHDPGRAESRSSAAVMDELTRALRAPRGDERRQARTLLRDVHGVSATRSTSSRTASPTCRSPGEQGPPRRRRPAGDSHVRPARRPTRASSTSSTRCRRSSRTIPTRSTSSSAPRIRTSSSATARPTG